MEKDLGSLESWRDKARAAAVKRWVRICAIAVAIIVIAIIIIPFFVNADTFRPEVESEISSALGRKVSLGHLSFSLLSGSLVANNVSIADDPAFSTAPFFQAKSLHIGVSTGALLFHHQMQVSSFTANSPQVQLIEAQNGTWNYASLGNTGKASTSQQQSGATNLTIGELKILNGSVTVSSLPSTGKPFVYDNVNLTVRDLSYATPMPFHLTADLPGKGSITLDGSAGPVSRSNAAETPLRASLIVKHFDPVAAGVVAPSEGISTVADIDAQLTSDGKTATLTGKVSASQLKLSANGSPAPQPVNVTFAVTNTLATHQGRVSDIAIQTGSVAAHVTGSYRMPAQGVVLDLHLAAPGLPVDGLEELLPAVGVKLPSGSALHGGTLTANFAITGPAVSPQIAGPVEIDNTQLAGFSLGSKIEGLASFGKQNNSGGTAIRTLRANLTQTQQSTQFSNIFGDVPSVGTATGSGSISPGGALDFQLVAKLNSSSGVMGAADTAMKAVGGLAGNFAGQAASNGIPLTVTGTTSDPHIRANLGAMLRSGIGAKSSAKTSATGLVKGLLGRK